MVEDLLSNDEDEEMALPERRISLGAQDAFLADFTPSLQAILHNKDDIYALDRCLRSAVACYSHMIENRVDETDDTVFLMYTSFFQPLMREALGPAMHQMLDEERQMQLVGLHNAEDYRAACQQFIHFVASFLTLHVSVLQGRELQPTISQRVGEDVAPLLRILSRLFESNYLFRSHAFHAESPATARGWVPKGLGSWAAPIPEQQQPGAPSPMAAADGTAVEDLTAEPPETPSAHLAVAAWCAAMIDCFGDCGGWDALLKLVCHPERLAGYLFVFLAPLGSASRLLLPSRHAILLQPAACVLQLVRTGLTAASDLSAVEDTAANPEQRVAKVLMLVRQLLAAAASSEEAEAEVGPLQREHVLRLLHAPAFTRQLAGIKQLRDLAAFTFYQSRLGSEAFMAWLQQHGIVQLVLKSNLHQAQYADQAQRVLSMLLQHDALSEEAIAFLWQLTEDGSTFEAVKSNVYSMLANLGHLMQPAQLAQLFARLQARATASGVSEAVSICVLLVGMAQRDAKGLMWKNILDCLMHICLRPDAAPEVVRSTTVVELCAIYDIVLGHNTCSLAAAQICIQQLDGDCAVPATVVLHSLLTRVWRKPDRMRVAMQHLNRDAELLKQCLRCFSVWLLRQKAAQGGADRGTLTEGPPAGTFSHRQSVDAWHCLLWEVIYSGNYYLLQEQLERMTSWATAEAVTAYDADQAWRLALLMVANCRKEVVKKVAVGFLLDCLCRLPAVHFTEAAWRCFLAYMTAVSDKWEAELLEEDVTPRLACVTEQTEGTVRTFLWRMMLDSHRPSITHATAHLLACIVSTQMRHLLANEPERWRQLLDAEVSSCLQQLRQKAFGQTAASDAHDRSAMRPGCDERPTDLASDGQPAQWCQPAAALTAMPPDEYQAAAEHCQRILRYLALLVDECQGKRMLSPPAHSSAWRGFPLALAVQLPAQQGHKQHKQELTLPANLPMGHLRRTVAEWLAKAPQFVRLLGGGREFESDRHTLAECRAEQQLIMAQVNLKPNKYSGQNIVEEQSAMAVIQALMQQADVYWIALSLADAPSVVEGSASRGIISEAATSCSRLAVSAVELLSVLPTCPAALQQLHQLLLAPDGGIQLRRLLMQQGSKIGAVKPALLMYTVQCLCVLLFPMGPGAACAAAMPPEMLQRRLLLSGTLEALLELATDHTTVGLFAAEAPRAAHSAVAAATHGTMVLLLHHIHAALHEQRMAADAAVMADAAQQQQPAAAQLDHMTAVDAAGAPTATATLVESLHMQVDSAGIPNAEVGGIGGDMAPAKLARVVVEPNPSPSASMAAANLGDDLAADCVSGEPVQPDIDAHAVPPGAVADREEAKMAAAELAMLAAAAARYAVRMLSCVLHCDAAEVQPSQTAVMADEDAGFVHELCSQALLLLRRLAKQSDATVHIITVEESTALEGIVRCLVLHPTSSDLRRLAASWLPAFAASAPAAQHWAFDYIVQPLLVDEVGGSSQEHMAMCSHFIETLDTTEFLAARQLLKTLLQRLSTAVGCMQPIDGIASVVGTLIKRLDCREVGLSCNFARLLIHSCCFPAVSAQRQLEAATLGRLNAAGAEAASVSALPPPPLQQSVLAAAATAEATAERCIAAAQAQYGNGSGTSSREAAFDLLLDLMLHDSGCWQYAQEQLRNIVHAAASSFLPQRFNNMPLQSLRTPGAFAGLQNGGATCYMSSVFQQLFMQTTIRTLILSAPAVAKEEQQDSVFHQMQVMFAHLALGVEPWFEPRGFWRAFKDYDGQPVNIREHQDAYEFFTRLQDSVDEYLRAQQRPRAIHTALGGTFAQLITVLGLPQYCSEREEEFYQISLDVRGKRTLAESLDSYVSKELMDGQNQYLCEELGKKVDAEKRTLIKELPHTLVLHLKRFEWDYETYQRWKVKTRFEFPMELDVYPYTVEGASEADGRPAEKKDASHYRYDLRGIVVHSGSAFAGHYYSVIKDRQPGGEWYCFDDTNVEPWDPAKLDMDCFGGRFIPEGFTQECDRPNSAYMLFYERADGAQPMAVSPAPPIKQQSSQQMPDVEMPAQQGGVAVAVAHPAAETRTPFNMPPSLYEAVLFGNLRQLGAMQLLSMEYCRFVWQVIHHLNDAVVTGTARKAAKREPTSSPGGIGSVASGSGSAATGACQLQALTNRRGGDLHVIIADAALLALDYCLQVALRGGNELRREILGTGGRKAAPGMIGVLREVAKTIPAVAGAVLLHLASGPCSASADALLTQHPGPGVRTFVRDIIATAADCLTCQELRTDEAVHAIRACINHLCGSTLPMLLQLQAPWHHDELLELLQRLSIPRYSWRRALLDAHLTPLLALVRRATEQWCLLDPYDREHNTGYAALFLLGSLLRRFRPEPIPQERSRRKPSRPPQQDDQCLHTHRNPHCLEGCELSPMPGAVVEWLYEDPTFPRKLLMAGVLHGTSVLRLLAFLQYENHKYAQLWQRAMLEHLLLDACDWRDLAMDLVVMLELVCLKDSLYEERMINIFHGVEGVGGILKAMMNPKRGVGCQHLLLALAVAVLAEAPKDLVHDVLEGQASFLNWAEQFLQRRRQRQLACEQDDSMLPDSPTYDDLCVEGQGIDGMVAIEHMWRHLDHINDVFSRAHGTGTSSRGSSSSDDGDGEREEQQHISAELADDEDEVVDITL